MTYNLHEQLHDRLDKMAAHRFTMLAIACLFVPLVSFAYGWYLIVGSFTLVSCAPLSLAAALGLIYVFELLCYLYNRHKAKRIEQLLIEIRKKY